MYTEDQKSGHVLQKYILNRISENEGLLLLPRNRMEVIMDQEGAYWLCDTGINQMDDLEKQGCWRCRDTFVMR